MVVRNGHISINGVPVAVDDKGFVVGRDGSLLPIKYQDFYRRASVERIDRILTELAQTKDVRIPNEMPPRQSKKWVPGPEIGLIPQFKLPREKRRLPKDMKHLINRLSSKMANLKSAVDASMQTATSKPSEPPRRTTTSSICDCINSRISSLRHHDRAGSLLENEQAISKDDHFDFILRAMRDTQLVIKELEYLSHKLSKSYNNMQKTTRDAQASNWALAKTTETFCTGTLSLENEEAYVLTKYYNLVGTLLWLQRKRKEREWESAKLKVDNQRLISRVEELESQIAEMTTDRNLVDRLQELADKVENMCSPRAHQNDQSACSCSPDPKRGIEESSMSVDSTSDDEEGMVGNYENDPSASWFKALQAHKQNWKAFYDLSDDQKKNHEVLHELKVECGTINDQNKRLTSRLGNAEINSAKLQDQLRDLLDEKQTLQQRLRTSQKLLKIRQKSLVSQPEEIKT
nr:uncharacterized protein LOC129266020 [Lytechinus pictus]